MPRRIPKEKVEEVLQALRARKQEAWSSVAWEYQDDAEFLLITIELDGEPLERNAPDRMYVYDLLEERIPPKENGEYSWMAVFTHNDEVCDSLMSGVS